MVTNMNTARLDVQ